MAHVSVRHVASTVDGQAQIHHNVAIAPLAGAVPDLLIEAQHPLLGNYCLNCEDADDLLFTNNDTNMQRLFGAPNATPYVKDAFHEYLVYGKHEAVNPERMGTKAAALYTRTIAPAARLT